MRLIHLIALGLLLLNSCFSTPDLDGLWKADFWDDAYIKFIGQQKLFGYDGLHALDLNEPKFHGAYRLYTHNNSECIRLGDYELRDSGIEHAIAARIKFENKGHIILINDERCVFDPYIGIQDAFH